MADASPASAAPPDDPLVGVHVGEYHIRRVLGRGGMGVVYEAEDTALGIPVALKSISAAFARDASFVRRFRTEARAMARVASPHIIRVMALRETEHGLFIVMEYADGGDLHGRMADGPMSWTTLWPLLRQMLLGLEAAHAVGVIHRDIKPRNVLLTRDGTVKLTDFGLARLQADGEATVTQAVAGTLAYMSPEQIRSLPTLDGRADLFSLALTAYEAMAGRLPFDRKAGEFTVMRAIVEEPFPPPTEFRADVPPGVARALMRALEKDPDQRYASAAAMREALAATGDDLTPTRTQVPPRRASNDEEAPAGAEAAGAAAVADDPAGAPPEAPAGGRPGGMAPPAPSRRLLPIAAGLAGLAVVLGGLWWSLRADATADGPADDPLVATTTTSPTQAPVASDTLATAPTADPGAAPATLPPTAPTTIVQQAPPVVVQQSPTARPLPAAPAVGWLSATAAPGVTLALDGSGISEGSHELRAGTYTVRCQAGPLSETTRVTIRSAQQTPVQCYAPTRTVSVNVASDDASRPWMSLVVDGQVQGQTPAQVTLGPGRHTVTVRRRNFTVVGETTQTVDVPPSFSPGPLAPVALQFDVRSDG